MIRGCIFDLDGVIVDTAKYHYLAWAQIANELGFEFTTADNEALKGVGRMESLGIFVSVGGMKDRFSEKEKLVLADTKNNKYVAMVSAMNANEIEDGVFDFISELRSAEIKVALGSSSKNAALVLGRLNITNLFDAIVDGKMISRSKPDPQIFMMGADMIRCAYEDCVVFEDAESGAEAAHKAGMFCVGVGNTKLHADCMIKDFKKFTLDNLIHLYRKK
ncbi:MAG: beta-phosphoglucomutase [Rikenellaceae bacterium]